MRQKMSGSALFVRNEREECYPRVGCRDALVEVKNWGANFGNGLRP